MIRSCLSNCAICLCNLFTIVVPTVMKMSVTLPNFVPASVHTVLTVASPLRMSPFVGETSVLRVYTQIDLFWSQFSLDHSLSSSAQHKLERKMVSSNFHQIWMSNLHAGCFLLLLIIGFAYIMISHDIACVLPVSVFYFHPFLSFFLFFLFFHSFLFFLSFSLSLFSLINSFKQASWWQMASKSSILATSVEKPTPIDAEPLNLWNWDELEMAPTDRVHAVLGELIWVAIMGGPRDTTIRVDLGVPSSFPSARSVFVVTTSVEELWMQMDHEFFLRCQEVNQILLTALEAEWGLPKAPSSTLPSLLQLPTPTARLAVWQRYLLSPTPARFGLERSVPLPKPVMIKSATKATLTHKRNHLNHRVVFDNDLDLKLESVPKGISTVFLFPLYHALRSKTELHAVTNLPAFVPAAKLVLHRIAITDLSHELQVMLRRTTASATDTFREPVSPTSFAPFETSNSTTVQSQRFDLNAYRVLAPSAPIPFADRFYANNDMTKLPKEPDTLPRCVWRVNLVEALSRLVTDNLIISPSEPSEWWLEISLQPPRGITPPGRADALYETSWVPFFFMQIAPDFQHKDLSLTHILDGPASIPLSLSNQLLTAIQLPHSWLWGETSLHFALAMDKCPGRSAPRLNPTVFQYVAHNSESKWFHDVSRISVVSHWLAPIVCHPQQHELTLTIIAPTDRKLTYRAYTLCMYECLLNVRMQDQQSSPSGAFLIVLLDPLCLYSATISYDLLQRYETWFICGNLCVQLSN
jgi:hypothetical protein